jgi:hypothetical protein
MPVDPRPGIFLSLLACWLAIYPAFSRGSDVPPTEVSANTLKTDQPADWHESWDKPYEEPDQALPTDEGAPVALPNPPGVSPSQVGPATDQSTSEPWDLEIKQPQLPSVLSDNPFSIPPPVEETNVWENWLQGASWVVCDTASYNLHLIWEDYLNYYTVPSLGRLALGIAAAAPLANTSADRSIRDWYQNKVRDPSADHYALAVKNFGEYTYAIPVYFGAALGGKALEGIDSLFTEDGSFVSEVGLVTNEWGKRCIRALAVGTPMVGVFQVVLGSNRPTLGSSYWNPFNSSHGVSGHAYIGSIPFLTAASMTDRLYLQIPLVFGSCLAGWSRIHTDDHYFSQVCLGWWMGFLAVRSVNQTEEAERNIQFLPGCTEGPGVSMLLRY